VVENIIKNTNMRYLPNDFTFKDITIIRQHFANEVLINDLWESKKEAVATGNLANYYKKIAIAQSFLDEMVVLTLTEPSKELLGKITGEIKTESNGEITPF
jgi:hypothetical protein